MQHFSPIRINSLPLPYFRFRGIYINARGSYPSLEAPQIEKTFIGLSCGAGHGGFSELKKQKIPPFKKFLLPLPCLVLNIQLVKLRFFKVPGFQF